MFRGNLDQWYNENGCMFENLFVTTIKEEGLPEDAGKLCWSFKDSSTCYECPYYDETYVMEEDLLVEECNLWQYPKYGTYEECKSGERD